MKNNKLYYIIAFFLPLVIGCKKSLDLKPINNISDGTYWQTATDFKLWANGFYGYLKTPAGDWVNPNLFDDNNSDIAGGLNNPLSNGTLTTPAESSLWNNSYGNIRNVNILLEHAATYAGTDNVKPYAAEAHFFRAYVYSNLLMSYGDVPLVTKTLDVNSPELYEARTSRDAIADFIINELNTAIPDLPLESAIATADKGRVTQGAAQGLLARVALFEGTWQKNRGNSSRASSLLNTALSASNAVIASNQYKLWSPQNGIALGDSTYFYLFVIENDKSNPLGLGKASNNEFILARKYDGNYSRLNVNIALATPGAVTRIMMDNYLCSDGLPVNKSSLFKGYGTQQSEFVNRDPRLKNTVSIPGGTYYNYANPRYPIAVRPNPYYPLLQNSTLYANRKFVTERALTDANFSGFDYPVVRYAEILLIYAEAKFELNNAISDGDLNLTINQLRDRVGMIHLTNALVSSNGLDMRTEIRRERTVELAYEGFRLTDLYRWKTAEVQMPKALTGVPVTPYLNPSSTVPDIRYPFLTRPAIDANGFYVVEQASSRHFDAAKNYLLPIPSQQIQQNPKLKQNPGW